MKPNILIIFLLTSTFLMSQSKEKCVLGNCTNGFGWAQYSGNIYIAGFYKDGKPNGFIQKLYSNGDIVYADVNGNHNNYVGLYIKLANGVTTVKNDHERFGIEFNSERLYVYEYKNGKAVNMKSLPTNKGLSCMQGDCYNGVGYKKTGGSKYLGQFKSGKRHGIGILQYENGDMYYGEFLEGEFSGYGHYKWKSGPYYFGSSKKGKWNGLGVMIYEVKKYNAGIFSNGTITKQMH